MVLARGLGRVCTIDLTPTQQGPHNPRILVRHCHCRPLPPPPLQQPPYPLATLIGCRPRPAQRRPRAVDEQFAYGAIAPLADPQQPGVSIRRVLFGHQTSPGGKLPAVLKTRASLTAAMSVVAVSGPIPGIVSKRWQTGCVWASALSFSWSYAHAASNLPNSSKSL
jgi:hypothetical protein